MILIFMIKFYFKIQSNLENVYLFKDNFYRNTIIIPNHSSITCEYLIKNLKLEKT